MKRDNLAQLADHPLNYEADQAANLAPQLRQLNLKLGLQSALELVSNPPSSLMVAGAVGLLLKRRFGLASLLVAGIVLRQALQVPEAPSARRGKEPRGRRDMEFERRALKAQRGDYGKLEVIPFK